MGKMGDVKGCVGSCWDCPVFPACLHEDDGYKDEGKSWMRTLRWDEIEEKGPGPQFDSMFRKIHKGSHVASYIVRIYRRDGAEEAEMLGTVEDIESEGRHAFRNFEELREILYKKEQSPKRRKHIEKAD